MKTFISKYNLKLKDNKVEIINLNSNNNGIIYINKWKRIKIIKWIKRIILKW